MPKYQHTKNMSIFYFSSNFMATIVDRPHAHPRPPSALSLQGKNYLLTIVHPGLIVFPIALDASPYRASLYLRWGFPPTTCQMMEFTMAVQKIVAIADMTRDQTLFEMGNVAEAAGGAAFDMLSRKARLAALIKHAWQGPDDYQTFRDIIHRKFAIGFYIKVCAEMGSTASAEQAIAALTAPTKNDAATKADARATAAFNDVFKATEMEYPRKRAPRASKANEDKSDKTDKADAPQGDAPQGDAPQGDAPSQDAPMALDTIANALAGLSIPDMMEVVSRAASAKAHNPGKAWSQFDLDCVKELAAVVSFWQAGEKAENAKDVTPPAETAKADAPKSPRKRGNKAADRKS